jgi:glycosyltransferase involved in cell wall biosynthesis
MSDAARRLRIGIVAPLWAAIPPRSYGGIERHLHLLVEELARRGHAVTLFATGDSRTAAALRPVCDGAIADTMDRGEAFCYEHYVNAGVAAALHAAAEFDVLHFHVGLAAVPLAELARTPVLHTMHNGITPDDVWVLNRHPDAAVTALSRCQIEPVPAERRESIRVVPYGFDFDRCAAAGPPEHLVFLGRMAPHKGPDEAVRIARAAGRPIVLAGAPVTASERAWFQQEVAPLLEAPDVTWIGGVGETEKDELFRRAAALLLPLRWDEPFGLVMLEALARGVPVLAVRRGSVPEVIEPGLTGWYAESPDELAAFVELAERLDRGAVRDRALQRFSIQRMTDEYLAVYAALGDEQAGERAPRVHPAAPRAKVGDA